MPASASFPGSLAERAAKREEPVSARPARRRLAGALDRHLLRDLERDRRGLRAAPARRSEVASTGGAGRFDMR